MRAFPTGILMRVSAGCFKCRVGIIGALPWLRWNGMLTDYQVLWLSTFALSLKDFSPEISIFGAKLE